VTGATATAAESVEITGVMIVTADAMMIEAVVEIVVIEMTGAVAATVTTTGAVKRTAQRYCCCC
jgi:predicted regulator of Ras-like GTPase activity (Roadblock/LC7/MglB family)